MKDFSGEAQGSRVGGEQDAIGGDQFADDAATMTPVNLKLQRAFWLNSNYFGIFRQQNAGANGGTGEAVHDFAGVDGAARNFFDDAHAAGIGPIDWGISQGFNFLAVHGAVAAGDFPDSGEREIGVDAKVAQDSSVAFQYIAQSRQISGSGFGENHAAGAAAGAVANAFCFEEKDGFFRCEAFENGGGSETGEAGADDGEVYVRRKAGEFGAEGDFPGRSTPVGS